MKFKNLLIVLLIILIISFFIYLSVNIFKNKRDTDILYNKIEELQQLVTAKQIYREVLYSKETKDFLWLPLSNKEFLISMDFYITAGIDISKGIKIRSRGDKKVVTLPKAQVISIDADDSSIKEYFVIQRFSNLTHDDFIELITESKTSILKGDNVKELLNNSERNARDILTSLLQLSGIQVDVEFSNDVMKVSQ